jgi:hypothetical protein
VANRPRVNPVLKPELERTQIDGENALGRFAQSRGIKRCCRTTDVEIRVPNSQWIFAGEAQYAGGFRSFRPEKARSESEF